MEEVLDEGESEEDLLHSEKYGSEEKDIITTSNRNSVCFFNGIN